MKRTVIDNVVRAPFPTLLPLGLLDLSVRFRYILRVSPASFAPIKSRPLPEFILAKRLCSQLAAVTI
jgi:hypothetical protein